MLERGGSFSVGAPVATSALKLPNASQVANTVAGLNGVGTTQAGSYGAGFNWTNGSAATQNSIDAAALANQLYMKRWQMEMDYNSAEAKKNREWQEKMANTAYQRAVADMKAAGINPILAAINGGAATGSGAQASTSANSAAMANSYADSYGENNSQSWMIQNAGLLDGLAAIFGAIGSMISNSVNSGGAAQKAFEAAKTASKTTKSTVYSNQVPVKGSLRSRILKGLETVATNRMWR